MPPGTRAYSPVPRTAGPANLLADGDFRVAIGAVDIFGQSRDIVAGEGGGQSKTGHHEKGDEQQQHATRDLASPSDHPTTDPATSAGPVLGSGHQQTPREVVRSLLEKHLIAQGYRRLARNLISSPPTRTPQMALDRAGADAFNGISGRKRLARNVISR